jgi:RNA 2',3'-cyclic 3'-phosphodiesterase
MVAASASASASEPAAAAPTLRLFYALWPDAATREALLALQRGLTGRPTERDNLHLTLAFLGQQPAATLPLLRQVLASLPNAPLPLSLDRSGYFPRHRIAWVGPATAPAALLDMQQDLLRALAQLAIGFAPPPHFEPHVTLARNANAAPEPIRQPIAWHSSQIVLAQSATLAQGARYEVLAARVLEPDAG